MTALLAAQDVSVTYRSAGQSVRALDGVSLSIQRGESWAILGPSGSGKTTLARVLAGLQRPDAGALTFDGSPPGGDFRRRVQVLFQDPGASLNPRQTVLEAVSEGLTIHRLLPRAEQPARVLALLTQLGLPPEVAPRLPHALSGGQRQRVALARALAVEPQVLIADEPFSALDVSVQGQLLQLLKDWVERRRLTLVLVTHGEGPARFLSRQVALLAQGKLVKVGQTAEVLGAAEARP